MAEQDTLLAYLVPAINPQVEPAATKALAYILNKSNSAMEAFNTLVRETTDQALASVLWTDAEVGYSTGGRPAGRLDLAGYDSNRELRVIVEAKFGATLLKGQGSDYLKQLSQNGKSVLMFLVPDYRIEYLWNEVKNDVRQGTATLDFLDEKILGRIRVTRISKPDSYLVMVSWRELLSRMERNTEDKTVKEDIHQLQGLAKSQDAGAFSPIEESDLKPDSARRILGFWGVAEAAINNCPDQGLEVIRGGYSNWFGGRGYYLRLDGIPAWFGVDCDKWSTNGETPFWLEIREGKANFLHPAARENFGITVNPRSNIASAPIRPKIQGVDQTEVVKDLVRQLKCIVEAINKP